MRTLRSALVVLSFALFLSACGSNTQESTDSKAGNSVAGQSPYDASEAPATADAAVRKVLAGMSQSHPEALWDFLPGSYQQDVNDVVHEFARRMDPELWSKVIALLEKVAEVTKAKKDMLADTITLAGRPGERGPSINFDGLANLLRTLIKSDLGNLERLKTADAGTILGEAGGQFLEQLQLLSKIGSQDPSTLPLENLSKLRVELTSSDDDMSVVLIRSPDAAPLETEFVRVEGKWIPRNLADSWIVTIGLAKARLSLLSRENLAEQKPRWMTLIASFDDAVDQIAAARDIDELRGAMQGLFLPGMMLAQMLREPVDADDRDPAVPEATAVHPVASELVTVVVRGKLSASVQDALLARLKSATGRDEGAFAEFTGDDESTSFKVGPVGDVEGFARSIDFLDVQEVDRSARQILAAPRN